MKSGRRRALLVISGAAGLLGTVALALGETGCDTGSAASPQNLGNHDSGLGSPTTTDDGSVPADATASTDASDGSVQDAGKVDLAEAGPSLNGCTTYQNHVGEANVNLQWDLGVNSRPDHCSKISTGASFTWLGNFSSHPLAENMGDTPNPITGTTPDGGEQVVTFPNAGIFGYICTVHGAAMQGAIVVVPP